MAKKDSFDVRIKHLGKDPEEQHCSAMGSLFQTKEGVCSKIIFTFGRDRPCPV